MNSTFVICILLTSTRLPFLECCAERTIQLLSMGFFDSSSPSSQAAPKASRDGTPEAPNRDQRAHCWEARDAFFKCLDANGIVDSIKDESVAGARCGTESRAFERDCASSWVGSHPLASPGLTYGTANMEFVVQVQYFKKRRVMEHNKNETLERIRAEGARNISGDAVGAGGGVAPDPR